MEDEVSFYTFMMMMKAKYLKHLSRCIIDKKKMKKSDMMIMR